jgi:hypothetical protein
VKGARKRHLRIMHRQPCMADKLHRLAVIGDTRLKTDMVRRRAGDG